MSFENYQLKLRMKSNIKTFFNNTFIGYNSYGEKKKVLKFFPLYCIVLDYLEQDYFSESIGMKFRYFLLVLVQ